MKICVGIVIAESFSLYLEMVKDMWKTKGTCFDIKMSKIPYMNKSAIGKDGFINFDYIKYPTIEMFFSSFINRVMTEFMESIDKNK
jgi:hypothetical protein